MKRAHAGPRSIWQILALLLAGWAVTLFVPAVEAQSSVDPWDVSWLPTDRRRERALDQAIDALLQETGLSGQGRVIRENAQRHHVNPAFALAMFRQEAGFASHGTLAHRNKNPANIIATGECWGEPKGTRCKGLYGEVETDGRFGRYATMADGITAFFLLMEREYAGMTLYALIARACPPSECDVPGYVARMETWTREDQALLRDAIQEPRAEVEPPHKPGVPQPTPGPERPVWLQRLWNAARWLSICCCGSRVLILVVAALAIVAWRRRPSARRVRPGPVRHGG